MQQLIAHATNDIAKRVGVWATQNACLEAYMLHAQIYSESPMLHRRPTICGSQITL